MWSKGLKLAISTNKTYLIKEQKKKFLGNILANNKLTLLLYALIGQKLNF